jgi:two-component system sensor histidine kinase MprB
VSFRARLIVVTTLAVSLAVLVACTASYLATRNAVQRSVDTSLYSAAQGPGGTAGAGGEVAGVFFQIVLADGQAVPASDVLPVDATVLAVANLRHGEVLRTVDAHGSAYRELIVPLAAGTRLRCDDGPCTLTTNAAQVFSVNITGQQHELRVLQWRLVVVALSGVLLALALGYLAAQAAMRPLESVTNEIENVAETSDVSYRLSEGRRDELGRLRRVFNQLLTSVEASQRIQRQLVLDSSHELRTPLTSLRTNAQVLSRANQLSDDELHQITDDMVAQIDELASLVTDLAELARGEGIDGTVEVIRLDELVDDCLETARTHARTRNVTVEATLDTCLVEGRRDRLARAVNNLINNAIKFTPPGGHVRVALSEGDLIVEDDGPGVDSQDAPFIFDRFWRSASARALPGSGLGLAIVSQVAQEMGGGVTVGRSATLGGAQFTLRLPTVPAGE